MQNYQRRLFLCLSLIVMVNAFHSTFAGSDERVTMDGANLTVKAPAGWTRAPVLGETPILKFWLCDPHQPNGCLVRAELTLTQLSTVQAPNSLDAQMASWSKTPASQIVEAPQRTSLGKHDAIELVTQGPWSYHVKELVFFDAAVLHDGNTYYLCSMKTDPAEYTALRSVFKNFCSSVRFSAANPE
ncbi:MAG: hypothetical protein ABI132_03000 [Rhodanobacteraceae bacterium]